MPLTASYTIPDHALLPDESPLRFILPYQGLRFLMIVGAKPDAKVSISPPGFAQARLAKPGEAPSMPISDNYVWVRLTGQQEGETELLVEQGTESLKVKINVLHWRWLRVAFYLVKDSNGRGNFNASQTGTHVRRCDKVYRPQACIDWSRQITSEITMSRDYSLSLSDADEATMWDEFGKKRYADMRGKTFFHVFCVKDWGGHDHGDYNAWATSHNDMLIIDDQAMSNPTPVLAHELGHGLGLEHTTTTGYVMKQGLEKGFKLTWADIQTVRTYVD